MSFRQKMNHCTCLMLFNMFIVDHQGTFYKWWYRFISLCRITSAYNYCIYAAYRRETYNFVSGNIYEVFFIFDILINLFLDFKKSPSDIDHVRDAQKSATRYVEGNFIWDFIPLIPFQLLKLERNF